MTSVPTERAVDLVAPSAAVAPTLAPGGSSGPVSIRANRLVIASEQLPVPGYTAAIDNGDSETWARSFIPVSPGTGDYEYIYVHVQLDRELIVQPTDDLRVLLSLRARCSAMIRSGGTHGGLGPTTALPTTAPALGINSTACAYTFEDGSRKFDVMTLHRNVVVLVQVSPRATITESAALNAAIEIALRQVGLIDSRARQ